MICLHNRAVATPKLEKIPVAALRERAAAAHPPPAIIVVAAHHSAAGPARATIAQNDSLRILIFVKKPLIDSGYVGLDSASSVEFLTMHGMFAVPSPARAEKS